jgi:hypothetical protein
MFESKTVFVVGAGASEEAGLPIGSKLTTDIASLLNIHVDYVGNLSNGDYEIYQALKHILSKNDDWLGSKFLRSAREIADAMALAQSIDTFLQSHQSNREFVLLGKLGIVSAIAQAEKRSKLAVKQPGQPIDIKRLAGTWYYSLARILFNGVPVEDPKRAFQDVSFIVFNYDRCLQTFLVRAVEIYFRVKPDEAATIVSTARFIHPYGSLGDVLKPNCQVPFAPERLDLISAVEGIKTFSEQTDSQVALTQTIFEAQKLIFLGFGFHEQNLEILDISEHLPFQPLQNFKRVFATTHGLSNSDEEVVRNQVAVAFHGRSVGGLNSPSITTENATCSKFFDSYWRSLSS